MPQIEPIRRYWSLDRTMLRGRGERVTYQVTDEAALGWVLQNMTVIGDASFFHKFDMILFDTILVGDARERVWVNGVKESPEPGQVTLQVYRSIPATIA